MNLIHVGDEDVEQIFLTIEGLKNGLSGGFQDMALYERAVSLQADCLSALASGTDNAARVEELKEMIAFDLSEYGLTITQKGV